MSNEELWTFIVKHFLKQEDLFWYTENLSMYSKSWTTINIIHIYKCASFWQIYVDKMCI